MSLECWRNYYKNLKLALVSLVSPALSSCSSKPSGMLFSWLVALGSQQWANIFPQKYYRHKVHELELRRCKTIFYATLNTVKNRFTRILCVGILVSKTNHCCQMLQSVLFNPITVSSPILPKSQVHCVWHEYCLFMGSYDWSRWPMAWFVGSMINGIVSLLVLSLHLLIPSISPFPHFLG